MAHEIFEGMGLMYMLCLIAMITTIVAIGVDLVAGVRKAKLRGEARTSYGVSRTFTKFLINEGILVICTAIDTLIHFVVYMMTDKVYLVPITTCVLGIFLCVVEGWSVCEKAEDKQRRKLAQVAVTAANLADKDTLKEIFSDAMRMAMEKEKKQE